MMNSKEKALMSSFSNKVWDLAVKCDYLEEQLARMSAKLEGTERTAEYYSSKWQETSIKAAEANLRSSKNYKAYWDLVNKLIDAVNAGQVIDKQFLSQVVEKEIK